MLIERKFLPLPTPPRFTGFQPCVVVAGAAVPVFTYCRRHSSPTSRWGGARPSSLVTGYAELQPFPRAVASKSTEYRPSAAIDTTTQFWLATFTGVCVLLLSRLRYIHPATEASTLGGKR